MAVIDKPKVIQVNIPEHLRSAVSASLVRVTTTQEGVIMDFVFAHPNDINDKGEQVGSLVSRLILPVRAARDLQIILSSHLGKIRKE